MQGIVLMILCCFFVVSWSRKDTNIKESWKNNILMMIGMLILAGIAGYMLVYTSYNYVVPKVNYSQVIESIEKNEEENEINKVTKDIKQETTAQNNNRIIEFIQDSLNEAIKDRFWHYIGAVCLLVFIYVWFKGSYMKNYRKILKAEIFNIHHKWLNRHDLTDVLISVNVNIDNRIQNVDMCEYLFKCFEDKMSGFFVILGNAGEGKTVSVRRLSNEVLMCFENTKGGKFKRKQIQSENDTVDIESLATPVLLNFTDLKNVNSVEDFLDKITEIIHDKAVRHKVIRKIKILKQNFHKKIDRELYKGKFLVLIDGYDEVNDEEKVRISQILLEFVKEYQKCYVIITSRTAVYANEKFNDISENRILRLAPLNKEKILEFLLKWNFEGEQSQWEIYERIVNNYQLERLAQNPLLLTLIAYLYEKEELVVPKTISDFYDNSMNCLLEDWEEQKKTLVNRHKVKSEAKIMALQNLANKVYENKSDVVRWIDMIRAAKPAAEEYAEEVKEVVQEIYKYSGIIEKSGKNQYKFYHRSFYEFFLAGYWVREKINIRDYLRNSDDIYNILFFYFSMQNVDKNTQVLLNKYIRDNIENDFIVDPLIIDCDINDNQLIEEYICKKIQRGRVMDISFCQNLGNIAKKYPLTQNIITAFFREAFEKSIDEPLQNDISLSQQNILCGMSYYIEKEVLLEFIQSNLSTINLKNLIADSGPHLNGVIKELFLSNISEGYKEEIIAGYIKNEQYNSILSILKDLDENCKKETEIIFRKFILLTKKESFVNWFEKHDISTCLPIEVQSIANDWCKTYGWCHGFLNQSSIINRYILVYYFIKINNFAVDELKEISNRLKFIATYICNRETTYFMKDKNYIDLTPFEIKYSSELLYFWKKKVSIKEFYSSPVLMRWIQIVLCTAYVFMTGMYITVNRAKYVVQRTRLLGIMDAYLRDYEWDKFYKLAHQYKDIQQRVVLKISDYINPNMNFWIFEIAVLVLLYYTLNYMKNRPYTKLYGWRFVNIGLIYFIGYAYIIQNTMLRLGIISVIGVMVCVNIIQYRYNKPSLKEPLYSMIKEYLEKDLL